MAERTKLDALQGLRGLAALLVVVDHSIQALLRRGLDIEPYRAFAEQLGGLGVCVFFVISGFIMTLTTTGDFAQPGGPRRFMVKRLIRIVPLYWVMTLLAFVVLKGAEPALVPLLVQSLLFIPALDDSGMLRPLYTLGWTLNFEMFFYLVFALALFFRRPIGLTLVIVGIGALCTVGTLFPHWVSPPFGNTVGPSFYLHPIMKYFVIGVGIGWLRTAGRLPTGIVGLDRLTEINFALIAIATIALYFSRPGQSATEWIYLLAGTLTVVLAATSDDSRPSGPLDRGMRRLGDISYSLYLTHGLLVGAFSIAWMRFAPAAAWPLFIVLSCAACTAISTMTYRWIEVPTLNHLRRFV